MTCVYVNPDTDQFWLIDYRIYDPEGDGKTKLDHVREMLRNIVYHKATAISGSADGYVVRHQRPDAVH